MLTAAQLQRVQDCVEQLLGSAASLRRVLQPDEYHNVEFLEALSGSISQCETCGGWVEWSELEEDNCADCLEDMEAL